MSFFWWLQNLKLSRSDIVYYYFCKESLLVSYFLASLWFFKESRIFLVRITEDRVKLRFQDLYVFNFLHYIFLNFVLNHIETVSSCCKLMRWPVWVYLSLEYFYFPLIFKVKRLIFKVKRGTILFWLFLCLLLVCLFHIRFIFICSSFIVVKYI